MDTWTFRIEKPNLTPDEVYQQICEDILPKDTDEDVDIGDEECTIGGVLHYELSIAFDVIRNVCEIYGDCAYIGDKRLVSIMVANALKAYETFIYTTDSLEATQAMRLAVFVSSLVSQITKASHCRVRAEGGGVWNPLFGASLVQFCKVTQGPYSWHAANLANEAEYRTLTYRDITTRKVTRLLLRNNYEQAVCVGDDRAFTPNSGDRNPDSR